MNDKARLIQKQLELGSDVEILLTTGEKVVGSLEEMSTSHLTLKRRTTGTPFTCMMDMIGAWQPIESGNGKQSTPAIPRRANEPRKDSSGRGRRSSSQQPARSGYAQQTHDNEGENLLQQARNIINRGRDREQAIPLLTKAIDTMIVPERAIRQLVSLYFQINQHDKIISLLEQYKNSINHEYRFTMQSEVYWQTRRYQETIKPLSWTINHLRENTSPSKRAYMYQQMGICYMQIDNLEEARRWFEKILEISDEHFGATKNLAICLLKQGKYGEVTEKLNSLSPTVKVTELLEDIENAHALGLTPQQIAARIFGEEASISNESTFTDFFLERSSYKGIPPEKVQEKSFVNNDASAPEELANLLGVRNPQERAEYFLSAAKILFESKEKPDYDRAYRNLCKSFTSLGDDAIMVQKSLETACEWYGEALRVYNGDQARGNDDGARFALVRFLYASTGKREIIPMAKGDVYEVFHTLERILSTHDELERIFHSITYLMTRSQYAADILLPGMYNITLVRWQSLLFLQQGKPTPLPPPGEISKEDFIRLWKEQQEDWEQRNKAIIVQFQAVKKVKINVLSSIIAALKQLQEILPKVFFHLDEERLQLLQKIFGQLQDLPRATTFETSERFYADIDTNCKKLLKNIEQSPTILSIEQIHPIVSKIQQETEKRRSEVQANFTPKISLAIPEGMTTQTLRDHTIEVPILITNQVGCGPADTLKLVVTPNPTFFELNSKEPKLEGLLRGGESETILISLLVTKKAINDEIFPLSISLQYHTYTGESSTSDWQDFSIELGASEKFERIDDPYIPYASGQPVTTDKMFYGRDNFIETIINAIGASESPNKSFVIYGQKRSGKTSILYHLMQKLKIRSNLLVVDIGSMGRYMNIKKDKDLLNKFLWTILNGMNMAIEEKISEGLPSIHFELPNEINFYNHPAPDQLFIQLVKAFHYQTACAKGWENTRIIVCADEFQYVYAYILNGLLTEFMGYWKALLQENLFGTILVGQDVMPKFIRRFANEFGVMEKHRVTYLSREYAEQLIEKPIFINGQTRYREREAIDYILQLTAGNPYYIQIICSRLVALINEKKQKFIIKAHVRQVQEEIIRGIQRLESEFDNLISSGDISNDAIPPEDALAVLKNIAREARESRDGFCPRDEINCETTKDPDSILKDLVMREVLEKIEVFEKATNSSFYQYKIKVELYRYWLLENA